ncbi:MAG TPA: EpsI family protein [Novosphingobium sp.]|nr:EpsI family protein [Novosphingobium sp.]
MIARRNVLLGGVYLLAAGLALARQPNRRRPRLARGALEGMVPNEVGSWRYAGTDGVVLPTYDELRDRLYDNIVSRNYASVSAPPVMLMLAYNSEQDGVLQIHRPETCYTAGGYALSSVQTIPLQIAPGRSIGANQFVATTPDRIEYVLYWTREGNRIPSSWLGQKRDLLLANLDREVPDGMLVRVSTLDGGENAHEVLARFVQSLITSASPRLRNLLVGPFGT